MRTCQLVVLALVSSLAFACGGGDDDGGDADGGGGDGESPVISEVTWTFAQPCTANETSDVVIEITVEDADTDAGDLTFSGSLTGCTGMINANPATISCPNAATYNGTVTATDPEGNFDMQSITVVPCTDGSVP